MQDQRTWDLRAIYVEPSIASRLYMLLLLVCCVVALIKLFKVWRVALPFRFSSKQYSHAYLRQLQASALSIRQWIGFALLAWGVLASIRLTETCRLILYDKRTDHAVLVVSILMENATYLSMALLVAVFLYLIRWHMLTRQECIHTRSTEDNVADSA